MNNLANRGLDPMKITYLLPESISESKLNSIDQRDSKAVQALRKQCFEEKLIEYQTDGINDNPVLAMIEKLRYYKQELSHANKIRQSEIEHANFKRNQEMINGKGMK